MNKKHTILYVISIICFIVFSMGVFSVFGITSYVSDTIYSYISQDTGGEVAGEYAVGMAIAGSDMITLKNRLTMNNQGYSGYIRCPSDSKIQDILKTPLNQEPRFIEKEWNRAAELIKAYGCGKGSAAVEKRLEDSFDYAEPFTPIENCHFAGGRQRLEGDKNDPNSWGMQCEREANTKNHNDRVYQECICGKKFGAGTEMARQCAIPYNCWYITIGIPKTLGAGMILGGEKLPSTLKKRAEDLYKRFGKKIKTGAASADGMTSGFTNLYYALYFNDDVKFNITKTISEGAARAFWGVGILTDWSFFYHGFRINQQYGARLATEAPDFMTLARGTSLQFGDTSKSNIFNWFKNWNQWTTYRGEIDPLIQHKWSYYPHGWKIVNGAKNLLKVLDSIPSGDGIHNQRYKPVLQGIVNKIKEPYGAISYPLDSYLVARKPRFFAGIKLISLQGPDMEASSFGHIMGSANILTPTNLEEKIGPSNTDSAVKKYPSQIVGLTTLNDGMGSRLACPDKNSCHLKNYAGNILPNYTEKWGWYGVTTLDGNYALAAQNYDWDLKGGNMKLQKAWFVFNDEILTTQTGDTTDSGGARTWMLSFKTNNNTINTSAGNKTLPNTNLGEPNWVYTNNFGYVFLKNEKVKTESTESGHARVYIDHRNSAGEFSSAAVLLPGATKNETQGYNDISIIKLDNQAHIVKEKDTGVIGAAIFGPGEAGTSEVKSNKPAYIMYKKSGNNLIFSLYNPHLEVNRKIADNCKYDMRVKTPTYTSYEITLPFTLTKTSNLSMRQKRSGNKDEVTSFEIVGNKIKVRLRANRMFEFKAVNNVITEAWAGLNDTTGGVVTNPNCTCNTTYSACKGGGCQQNQKLATETCTGGCTASSSHCVNRSECGEPDNTCSSQNGNICTTSQTCPLDFISSTDSNRCCSQVCVNPAQTCSSLQGSTCSSTQYCDTTYLPSSDPEPCCPQSHCKTKTADLNCSDSSHKIGFKDLTVLIAYWGEFNEEDKQEYESTTFYKDCGETDDHTPDLNGDGKVDIDDFALFLNQWSK